MYRSLQFYLTIEKALLCGNPLLVESVTTPFDPALQPLLEMLHTWNNKGELSIAYSIHVYMGWKRTLDDGGWLTSHQSP